MKLEKEALRKVLKRSIPFSDRNFRRILQFYLFESPVEGKSFRGKTFSEQGWKGAYFSSFKAKMLQAATPALRKNYHPCKKEEVQGHYDCLSEKKGEEYCIFMKWEERRIIEALFSAIRNSFAHGSFDVKQYTNGQDKQSNRVCFLVNYDNGLKAVIVLREETLLAWIDLFYSEPSRVTTRKRKIDTQ